MDQLNVLGIETPKGYRTFELLHGDLTTLREPADVLLVSAFAGSYEPTTGTVAGALYNKLGIDLERLAAAPEYDLRSPLGTWVSRRIEQGPFGRIVCAEFIGTGLSADEVLSNAFATLSMLEAKGQIIRSVASPVLGAGAQRLVPAAIITVLLSEATNYLRRSVTAQRITFIELDQPLALALSQAMDAQLGRVRTYIQQDQLMDAVRKDIKHKLQNVRTLFVAEGQSLREEWLGLMERERVPSVELGVLGRRLVELMVTKMRGPESTPLYQRIRALESDGIAPWVCGYMHVLRHVGNESAHDNAGTGDRRPPTVEPRDLTLCLFCVERLLDYWGHYQDPKEGRSGV